MPKDKKLVRSKELNVRLTTEERGRLNFLAKQYAGGDVSKWVRYAIFSASRKMLNKKPTTES